MGRLLYNRTPSAANSYLPSPLLMAGLIGMRTQRLKVGTCVLLLPLYHPVHLAEDCAIVDLANKGRLVVSVGVGYQPRRWPSSSRKFPRRASSPKDVIFVRLTGGARWIRTLERLCKRSASYSKASKSSKWLPQRGAEQILSLETLARWGLSSSAYFRDHLTGFLPARSAAGMSEHFLDWYPTDG